MFTIVIEFIKKILKPANARKALIEIAAGHGCSSLLSIEADAKTSKGEKLGITTGILYMMPDDQLCPVAKAAGCREACLVSAGRAAFTPGIGKSRAGRTQFYHQDREKFMELLVEHEIPRVIKAAEAKGNKPAVRLNGTSDINWSKVTYKGLTVFEHYPNVMFYDYTKSPAILRSAASVDNWQVTASYSEASIKYARMITKAADESAANLAVVFRTKELPETFLGRPVIDGDESDVRFMDPRGVIVGLKAKGSAKKDDSGFVVDNSRQSKLIPALQVA